VTYLSVVIPWVGYQPTPWHPSDPGFAPICRGCFRSVREAHDWARDHLRGHPYRLQAGEDGRPPGWTFEQTEQALLRARRVRSA